MNKLKKQIRRKELAIHTDTYFLKQQHELLNDYIHTNKILPIAVMGSLAIGYLFSRKKNRRQLLTSCATAPFKIKAIIKRFEAFLPFFPF